MATFTVYKLHFISPVHIGDSRDDYGISLKTIQSDTMYAAIISCLAKLGERIPNNGELGCTISSLFPFYQKNKEKDTVYFFPKPLKQTLPLLENIENAKKIKKVSWLDQKYFEREISGDTLFSQQKDINDIKDEYLTSNEIDNKFISSQVSPRVTVSRTGKENAVPFYMDRVYFKDYSGLFFMAIGNTDLLEKGLNLLQHEGIGTDRNVGNGYFVYEKDHIDIVVPKKAVSALSLSMFIPESKEQLDEMLKGEVAYNYARRGGWITTAPYNTIRKNVVHAFMPSSVFSMKVEDYMVNGKIVDLCPDIPEEIGKVNHPIWRNGKSIFIPIKQ